jgi:hypothetical protein
MMTKTIINRYGNHESNMRTSGYTC